MRSAVVVLAVWSAGMLALACGGGGRAAPSGGGAKASIRASAVEMEADDFYFEPETLEARVGEAVTLTVKNEGGAVHTFTIDELNVDQTLRPGDEVTVTLTPARAGSFTFYCRFHRARGMEGTMDVAGG